jgi:hypothetical protein
MTYTLTNGPMIIRDADGAFIPTDPANVDYQTYLDWVAAGNTATPAPVPPPTTTLTSAEFFNRFTAAEQGAIQAACTASASLGVGLTLGLAQGFVVLTSPILANWMNGLVAAGALTAARMTEILTP